MTKREITVPSPAIHTRDPQRYANSSFEQHWLMNYAWNKYLEDPFEHSEDLRGRKFEVVMHEDGLHVTVREA